MALGTVPLRKLGPYLPVRLGLSGRNSRKNPERPRKRSQSVSWNQGIFIQKGPGPFFTVKGPRKEGWGGVVIENPRGGYTRRGGCTRAKWVPFVLLAFFPLVDSIFRFKIGHFPFKT